MVEAHRGAGQDRAVVVPVPRGLLLVVADGAGGIAGGAEAAQMVVESIRAAKPRTSAACVDVLKTMDHRVAAHTTAGETTAVVATIAGTTLAGASVGDSVAWVLLSDEIVELTAQQVRKPLIGSGRAEVVPFEATLESGTLLLATDGLHRYAQRDAIRRISRGSNVDSATRNLVELVRLRSGDLQDDIAVILFRLADARREDTSEHPS
ncbi:MAG: SpoIIE family protein phosphatase [Myxococcota bacterium]